MAEKDLTKEEWGRVEKAVSGRYGNAKLKVDGRDVTFAREMISKNRLGVVIYVDGKWEGKWFGEENEEIPEQRYLCPHEKYVYGAKHRAELKKISKKRRTEWGWGDPDRKRKIFYPYASSLTPIRRHYQKTFASIELVEVVGA
jgi:hypothetical protein